MPLFVWADRVDALDRLPGDLQFADHTWVTSYGPVPECPPDEADGDYWYCWGACHATPPANAGARLLAEGEGDIEFARRSVFRTIRLRMSGYGTESLECATRWPTDWPIFHETRAANR